MGRIITFLLFVCLIFCLVPVFASLKGSGKPEKRGSKEHSDVPKGLRWLKRSAGWILCRMPRALSGSRFMTGHAGAAADRFYMGKNKELFCREHKIRKIMVIYGGALAALVFMIMFTAFSHPAVLEGYSIRREDAGGRERDVVLRAYIEGTEKEEEISVTVRPRKYSEQELDELIGRVMLYIDETLPGENESLEKVNRPLYFASDYPGENITIEWEPEDYNLIASDGSLCSTQEYELPAETSVTAVICCGDDEFRYEKRIIVTGREMDEESIAAQLEGAVREADEASAGDMEMALPQQVDGHDITWGYKTGTSLCWIVLMAVCIIAFLVYYQEEQLKEQMEERTTALKEAYPVFVHRMVLMLGAGMTVRRSLEQLAADYERDGAESGPDVWIFRELKYAGIQMESGVPETEVYMSLGRRTELPEYMKFSQLLLQWIKRGSRGMEEMMRQEAYEAEKQRRDTARRRGETAGTKLMLPMMILLVIVLGIVMAPALISM